LEKVLFSWPPGDYISAGGVLVNFFEGIP